MHVATCGDVVIHVLGQPAQQTELRAAVTVLPVYWQSMQLQHLCPIERTTCGRPSEAGSAYLPESACNRCGSSHRVPCKKMTDQLQRMLMKGSAKLQTIIYIFFHLHLCIFCRFTSSYIYIQQLAHEAARLTVNLSPNLIPQQNSRHEAAAKRAANCLKLAPNSREDTIQPRGEERGGGGLLEVCMVASHVCHGGFCKELGNVPAVAHIVHHSLVTKQLQQVSSR